MRRIGTLFDRIPYLAIVIMVFIGAAVPFDSPHLIEKSKMLIAGDLSRPIDIVDLVIHSLPLLLLLAKASRDVFRQSDEKQDG